MRTTVEINDELFRAAKRRASEQGTSLRAVIEQALRALLVGAETPRAYRLRWRTERGSLRAGLDVSDRNALFDVMDGR